MTTPEQFAALLDEVAQAAMDYSRNTDFGGEDDVRLARLWTAKDKALDAYAQATGGAVKVLDEPDAWLFRGKGNGEGAAFATVCPPDECTQHYPLERWTRGYTFTPLYTHPPAEAAPDATSSVDYWQKRGHHVCPECNGTRVRSYRLADHLGGQYVDAPCRCVAPPAEASTWQPIESAPKDGTSVLLLIDPQDSAHSLHDDSFVVSIGSYGVEGGAEVDPTWCFAGWSWSHDEYVRGKGTPTHWMPLPGPPRAALSGRKEGSV